MKYKPTAYGINISGNLKKSVRSETSSFSTRPPKGLTAGPIGTSIMSFLSRTDLPDNPYYTSLMSYNDVYSTQRTPLYCYRCRRHHFYPTTKTVDGLGSSPPRHPRPRGPARAAPGPSGDPRGAVREGPRGTGRGVASLDALPEHAAPLPGRCWTTRSVGSSCCARVGPSARRRRRRSAVRDAGRVASSSDGVADSVRWLHERTRRSDVRRWTDAGSRRPVFGGRGRVVGNSYVTASRVVASCCS